MNILLYVNSFLPTIGGKQIVVHYLAREFMRQGHRARVVVHGGFRSQAGQRFEYPVHRWPIGTRFTFEKLQQAQLLADITLWGADIIHAHTSYPNGYLTAGLRRFCKTPLVVTPHGDDINVVPEIGFGMRLDPVLDRKITMALNAADAITAISDTVQASIAAAGIDMRKVIRINNGVDSERFNNASLLDHRLVPGLKEMDRIILVVGNYHPRKGHDLIVEAMPSLLQHCPQAHLVLVGSGNEVLHPTVKKLNLQRRVSILGSIPFPWQTFLSKGKRLATGSHDLLAQLYRAASVYLTYGRNEGSEGMSLAMLDAMAAGKAIAAADISGNRDVISNRRNGLLVPKQNPEALVDALAALISDARLSARLGEAAKETAKRYNWTTVAAQYTALYNRQLSFSRSAAKK